MSTLALSLIQQCLDTQNPYLDLGNCGLTDALVAEGTDIDIALRKCMHLKTLILSSKWNERKEEKKWKEKKSQNTGEKNFFTLHPPALPFLSGLEELRCGGNYEKKWEIKDMSFVETLPNLVCLDISYNQIMELKGLDKLTNLQDFYISRNQIFELKGLDKLTNLQSFYISDNQISELKGLDKLTNLQSFYISDNQISELKGLDKLTNLQSFYISDNQISELKGLDKLTNLQSFEISSNKIAKLKGLDKLTNLQSFGIARNQIAELKGLDKLNKLQEFYISYNKIVELKGLDKLSNLQEFFISNNQISELKGLDKLTNLQSFYISDNQISELKGLDKLTNLQSFYISNNQITELKGLDKLTNLQSFFISNNQIADIQYLIPFYKNGIDIYIGDNPITNPPLEIVEQGDKAILEWFETNALSPLNECKLLFVGDGGVGKTSLMRRVMGKAFNDKESTTHGINKIAWKEIQNVKGEEIRVNLWDFGGQHIQHSLHQFFFTQRVIYVLVLDPRNDNNAYYWLEQIEKLGCDSEVLIVHNWREKKDIQANYLGNFYELRKKYPRLPEPFLLSCRTDEGLPEFKEKLKTTILAQKDLAALYPEKWYNIKRELEATTEAKDYIRYESYEEICDTQDYKDEERQRNLLLILDKIGSIVFFNEPILNHLQVLNPDWITTGAYTILTSGVTSDKKGHLAHADLKAIFQAEIPIFSQHRNSIKYRENQFDFILHLMLKFDLCQRNPFVEHEYLVPAAFDGKQTQDYSDFKTASKHYRIQFSASFEMIIMHKFIARNIAKCVGRNYWASGLHLKDAYSQTFALVETEQYSQLVNFWIQGENIVGFWQLLSNDMKDICKKYYNFKLEEQVYYQKKGKEAFLSYQEMLKCAQKRISVLAYHPTYDMEDIEVYEVLSAFQKPLDRQKVQELIEEGNFVEVFELLDRQDMGDKYLYNRLKKEYMAGAQGIELMDLGERLKTLVNDWERRG